MTSKTRNLLISGCALAMLAGLPLDAFAPPPPADGTLLWHTYQGGDETAQGSNWDRAMDMARDAAGNVYVVGHGTGSWNVPFDPLNPVNPHSPVAGHLAVITNQDVFVAKFAADGTLVWHTFLGAPVEWWGSYYGATGWDEGMGIAVDAAGGVLVTGMSTHTWGTPIVPHGGYQFNRDAFLAKLDAASGALVWNTFLGGGAWNADHAYGVDVDAAGNIYVTGISQVSWGAPVRPHFGGYGGDAFAAKYDSAGHLVWNTFLGGTNYDIGYDIGLDATGRIYVVGGSAYGNPGYCPPVEPPQQNAAWCDTTDSQLKDGMLGGGDAFVAALDPGGTLDWYGFHGGDRVNNYDYDEAYGIAVDDAGRLFVTGVSWTPWPAPVTVDAHKGFGDQAFVARIDGGSGALLGNTFMANRGSDIALDGAGNVFVGGNSATGYGTGLDMFACHLDDELNREWCRHLFSDADGFAGCGGNEIGNGVAVAGGGAVYVAGFAQYDCGAPLNHHADYPAGLTGDDMLLAKLYYEPPAAPIGMIIDDVDGEAHIFDPATDTVTAVVDFPPGWAEGDCAITPDGSLGFVTSFDPGNVLQVIDLSAIPPAYAGPIPISNAGEDLSMTPDGKYLLVADGAEVRPISVVDIGLGVEIGIADLTALDHNSVDVCADGTVLATSYFATFYGQPELHAGSIDGAGVVTPGSVAGLVEPINSLCVPGNATALGVSAFEGLFSYSLPGLAPLDFVDPGSGYTDAAIAADGTRVFLRGWRGVYAYDYDPATGLFSPLQWFTLVPGKNNYYWGMDQLRLHPDGNKLYVGNLDGEAWVLDPADGTILPTVTAGIAPMEEPTGICIGGGQSNSPPAADDQSLEFVEDSLDNPITLTATDPDGDSLTFQLVGGSGPAHGTLAGTVPNLTYTPFADYFGPDSFRFTATDESGAVSDPATVFITVTPVNDAPIISISRATATLQYSDTIGTVTITATDVDDAPLVLTSEYTDDDGNAVNGPFAGLPIALGTAGSCTTVPNDTASPGTDCSWDLTGQMLEDAGDYDVTFSVTDGGGGTATVLSASDVTELIVEAENASVSFEGGNPVAVQVAGPGGASGPFSLTVYIEETEPDLATFTALFGDLALAMPHIVLKPVGPGGEEAPDSCDAPSVAGIGYDQVMTFTCHFSSVPVNTYSVYASVDGGYYTGSNDDVVTVFDPSLGFTTGGGWFYWPGTDERTNFGYTMKYNKKRTNIQGSLLLIRHIPGAPEGFDKYRIKSNALHGLALGEDGDPVFGWASFSGKATYKEPGADNEGNHEFTVYVEDHGEPGTGADQFWIQTRDKQDDVIDVMSLPFPGAGNTETLNGGNIVVPH